MKNSTLVDFSAIWSFSAIQFFICSAVQSDFWRSGFLFIRRSGFDGMDKFGQESIIVIKSEKIKFQRINPGAQLSIKGIIVLIRICL